ncbi:TrbC/VirB2 family protein [Brevibacillus sp. FSL L8-0520]|uniref:TrbC/VirB2 family protein n=1 Tax=Brevibacillus sp. FSL L8-0520 TaxID=2954689 RepID=UPI0030D25358
MFLTVSLPKVKRQRYEVVPWRDFFAQTESVLTPRQKRKINALLAGATAAYVLRLEPASAAGIADRIVSAFNPLIELVQGVSYPVAFLMICGSFLLIMVGQRSKGLAMLKWASVGYIGLQFAPAIMQILVSVGKAMMAK